MVQPQAASRAASRLTRHSSFGRRHFNILRTLPAPQKRPNEFEELLLHPILLDQQWQADLTLLDKLSLDIPTSLQWIPTRL